MICVVGSSNFDVVVKVRRFTLPGETQKAKSVEFIPGGKGANQALTASKISKKKVSFLTCIGNDYFGNVLRQIFDSHGIEGYFQVEGINGLALIEVEESGQNRIVIYSGTNSRLTVENLESRKEVFAYTSVLLLQNEIPFETTFYAAKLAKQSGATVIFDPAPASGVELKILEFVDYLTPNEVELDELSREWFGKSLGPSDFYKKLSQKNPDIKLIAKLGEKGVRFFAKDNEIEIRAIPVKAVDTTAAGDVFNGSFAAFLDEGIGEDEAIQLANIAAAISVTRYGAQTSIPTREEIFSFVAQGFGKER